MTRRSTTVLALLFVAAAAALLAALLWSPALASTSALAATRDVCPSCGFPSIQAAINVSADGDSIRVAGGVGTRYSERLTISKTVHILGGFSGPAGGWQRNIAAYPTTIDGQSGGSVVTVLAGAPTIEGFIITGGLSPVDGGGLLIQAASPLISATTVISNSAASSGGGIAVYGGSPRLANSTVRNNTAMGGGGLLIADGSTMEVRSSIIIQNMASFIGGGLLVVNSSTPALADTTIQENRSPVSGGMQISDSAAVISGTQFMLNHADVGFGGGLSLNNSTVTLQAVSVVSNTASANGGGVYAENSTPTLRDSIIRGNQASGGGGVYMLSSLGGLTDNEISANRANEASGGGVLLDRSAPTVDRNRLAGNSAALDGGAVAIVGRYCASEVCDAPQFPHVTNSIMVGNNAAGKGAGVHIDAGSGPDLVNNTVVGNSGAGIYIDAYAQAYLTNTIVVSNTAGIRAAVPSAPFADYNLVWGNNSEGNYVGLTAGAHDISLDPRFASPATSDFHLTAHSPALDAGRSADAPATDHDGVSRPQAGSCGGPAVADIGAYEYVVAPGACLTPTATATASATATPPVAASATPTPSRTSTGVGTATATRTGTRTATATATGTRTATATASPTPSATATSTAGVTVTATPTTSTTPLRERIVAPVIVHNFRGECLAYEGNDAIETAWGPLSFGLLYEAFLCSFDPVDWYYVSAWRPGGLTVDVRVPALADLDLFLYDGSGALLAESATIGEGTAERVVIMLPGAGRYFIKVQPFSRRDASQPYGLLANFN